MKKAITLLLAILLTLSVFALTACEDNSLEAQLRRAQENTKNAEEVYQKSKDNASRLEELREQYDALQTKINGLQKGSTAYQEAIEENNRLVKQIVKEFPEMAPYVTTK